MKRVAYSLIAASGLVWGCSTTPETPSERAHMTSAADAAMVGFHNADPSLQDALNNAAGYAIFPELGKAGLIVGGSYGNGEVFERGIKVGYAELAQGTIGAQLGAQVFSELIVFKTQEALNRFKGDEFTFAANATAVAIKPNAAVSAPYSNGVAVFVQVKGGLMAEASVGGQHFEFRPL